MSPPAKQAFDHFMANTTITVDVAGCDGTCSTKVRGPGITLYDCKTQSWPLTSELLHSKDATWGSGPNLQLGDMPTFATSIFDTGIVPGYVGPETMALLVARANYQNCSGQYTETICYLQSAIVEYEVTIEGRHLSFSQFGNSGRVINIVSKSFTKKSQNLYLMTIDSEGQ